MPRVYSQKSRKERTCGKCGGEIKKGDPYLTAAPGFRTAKLIRCADPACRFRQSELTTSKMSGVYAAIEDAEDAFNAMDPTGFDPEMAESFISDEIQPVLDECASQLRDVAEEYREASQAWANGAGNVEFDERADNVEAGADEVEQFDHDEFQPEEDEDGNQDMGAFVEWVTEVIDAAKDHVNGASVE